MRIDSTSTKTLKATTADDTRCCLVVDETVWCGHRNGTIHILDRKVSTIMRMKVMMILTKVNEFRVGS